MELTPGVASVSFLESNDTALPPPEQQVLEFTKQRHRQKEAKDHHVHHHHSYLLLRFQKSPEEFTNLVVKGRPGATRGKEDGVDVAVIRLDEAMTSCRGRFDRQYWRWTDRPSF